MNLFDNQNKKLYFVCFVPRSGSNHLCSMLEKHGLGTPAEFYYPYKLIDRFTYWHKRLPRYFNRNAKINEEEYFNCILGIQKSIAGIKVSWDAMNIVYTEIGNTIQKMRPKFIYVTRRDKIRQAISWAISLETNIWSSDDLINKPKPKPKFSRQKVDECLQFIQNDEDRFEQFFKSNDCFRITYEEFDDKHIKEIADYLNVEINYRRLQVMDNYVKTGDGTNEEWYRQYVST